MKKEIKKTILLVAFMLLFVTVGGRKGVEAAIHNQPCKKAICVTSSIFGEASENAVKLYRFDNVAVSKSSLVNSPAILYKKNTPTPTPSSKKSSEKEEEDNYGLGGFVVLVILAVLYFRSQKRKNTIYIKRK